MTRAMSKKVRVKMTMILQNKVRKFKKNHPKILKKLKRQIETKRRKLAGPRPFVKELNSLQSQKNRIKR